MNEPRKDDIGPDAVAQEILGILQLRGYCLSRLSFRSEKGLHCYDTATTQNLSQPIPRAILRPMT